MTRPRLRAHYAVERAGDDAVFLLSETGEYVFENPLMQRILSLLEGTLTVPELCQALAPEWTPMAVVGALTALERAGHLTEGPSVLDERVTRWRDAMGLPAHPPARPTGVGLVALHELDPQPFVTALGDTVDRVEVITPAAVAGRDPADVVLVLTEDYLDAAVGDLAETLLRSGSTWGLAKPTGRVAWVGPFFVPGRTGCWACLEQRLRANRQVRRFIEARRGEPLPPHRHGTGAATAAVTAGLLASALSGRILAGGSDLDGILMTLDLRGDGVDRHTLVRQPQCRWCGDPTLATSTNPKISLDLGAPAGAASGTADNGYRVCGAEVTLGRLEKHISPQLGAINALIPMDDSTVEGITHAYAAAHNFPMVQDSVATLRRNMRATSGGKGRTVLQAKVSAVCEALERYAGVWRGDEHVRRAAHADLDPAQAVHPYQLTQFSAGQYERREAWNREERNRLHLVPERFDDARAVDWSQAWSLTQETERLLPSAYIWYGHPDLREHFFCVGDSNGCASGNTLDEAILQGLTEVIERDAVAIWWYNRLVRPEFDLDSLGEDEYVGRMRAFYAGQGRRVWALDITADIGVPTVVAVSARDHDVEDIMVGFGSHPDPSVAAMRAVTELNQFLPFVRRRDAAGNTLYLGNDPAMTDWARGARLDDNPWLAPDPAARVRTVADHPWDPAAGLAGALERCVRQVESAGLEVIAVDQTRPDVDLNVAKVIVPGARHFWRRLGPGRLYDVPVSLGWRATPTDEADLNPRSVFF